MNNVILWTIWYGLLVLLPPLMTRVLIKHATTRVETRRRAFSREKEV